MGGFCGSDGSSGRKPGWIPLKCPAAAGTETGKATAESIRPKIVFVECKAAGVGEMKRNWRPVARALEHRGSCDRLDINSYLASSSIVKNPDVDVFGVSRCKPLQEGLERLGRREVARRRIDERDLGTVGGAVAFQ